MRQLNGQRVLITGAASGLGRELARQLAGYQCRLALLDVNAEQLQQAAAEALDAGAADAHAVVCDITELEQVAVAMAMIEQQFGRLDILINNAGIFTDDEIERRDPERRRTAFLVNALGPIQVTDAALALLRRSDGAHVVNVISSSGASDTEAADNRRWSTYGATKAALAGYTTTLTRQLSTEAIKVSGIFPGGFESDMYESAGTVEEQHDAFWMMRTEDVADVIVFALTRPLDVNLERVLVTKMFSAS